ncbi:S8 family serine peptidase [Marinobacter sp. TBZ242]|uniref:S8 family serine peptidase n=1 Tax=Marinobacter azerbaijanicus TaxID=3050455 RepID=A0ABT7IFF1_9GAMM|nr:S8 family serine peptidase [Marinobacter sp. TBZ242]MDL0432894.1 S8 family serine peptidase [Marinobacter sp. TBZ242]
MKHLLMTRLLPVILLCPLSAPAMALTGGSLPDSQATRISRQVEEKAGQLVERAMDRRLEKQAEAKANAIRERLAELPAALPIHTTAGQKAFNEVALDDGFRAVERQWMVTGTASDIDSLRRPGITLLERRELSGLGMTVARFRVTPELDSRAALEKVLPELAERLDRNHVFEPQAAESPDAQEAGIPQWQSLCSAPARVGMVDTSIATDHPVFRTARIVQERFLAMADVDGQLREPRDHGTAVASLMVGSFGDQWPARLPQATVFNASVFYDRDRSLSGATLGHLLEGLNWLANQDLAVINISLTGPDNRLLATAVDSLREQGILLVAAVGNQGPAAGPLYPAAYPDVVGVTAVDASGELYRWANRGEQVMFAGPGVSVPVADPDGGMRADSGTSLAAPVVTAAIACRLARQPADQVIRALVEEARDLGRRGRDNSFGHGLLDL